MRLERTRSIEELCPLIIIIDSRGNCRRQTREKQQTSKCRSVARPTALTSVSQLVARQLELSHHGRRKREKPCPSSSRFLARKLLMRSPCEVEMTSLPPHVSLQSSSQSSSLFIVHDVLDKHVRRCPARPAHRPWCTSAHAPLKITTKEKTQGCWGEASNGPDVANPKDAALIDQEIRGE